MRINNKPPHLGGGCQILMEGVALDYINNYNIVRQVNPLFELYSYFSEDYKKDAPHIHDNIYIF